VAIIFRPLRQPFHSTDKAITDLYGPVPVAYLKLVTGKNISILIGALPTLMGAEYIFDFENMNIERGLLWNQENAVNRGIQVNQTPGKFTASMPRPLLPKYSVCGTKSTNCEMQPEHRVLDVGRYVCQAQPHTVEERLFWQHPAARIHEQKPL
jgi:hypothetical protein